jgi:hypothetical protein
MNNQEARFILSAYRPGGQDAADPDFREALDQAQRDPALGRWFTQQTATDAQFARAVETIHPPADLRANILAGARLTQQKRRWQFVKPLAIAAAVMLAATFALTPFVHLHQEKKFTAWQAASIATINDLVESKDHFSYTSGKPDTVSQWLQASYAPAAPTLTPNLSHLRALGCKVIESGGHRISILCMHLTPTELVHLVTYDSPTPMLTKPRFMQHNGWNTATWTADGKTYMLATKADEEKLKQLLL